MRFTCTFLPAHALHAGRNVLVHVGHYRFTIISIKHYKIIHIKINKYSYTSIKKLYFKSYLFYITSLIFCSFFFVHFIFKLIFINKAYNHFGSFCFTCMHLHISACTCVQVKQNLIISEPAPIFQICF